MARWNEDYAKLRTDAYDSGDLDGGVVLFYTKFIIQNRLFFNTHACYISQGNHEHLYFEWTYQR